MSQSEKSSYWKALKEAGVQFDRHYREYTTEELKHSYETLQAATTQEPAPEPAPAPAAPRGNMPPKAPRHMPRDEGPQNPIPRRQADPNELPGQRLNSKEQDEPIRIDEQGLVWYQEEVRKPASPKPRGRRVLKYMDPGVRRDAVTTGEYTETFEVAGGAQVPSEVKITLPSYQVGIYKDPRLPFKIHIYNGNRGFNRHEVEKYYGGRDLVPEEVKSLYVENVLCYDIRSTVRAIESEYRRLQLQGKV